MSLLLRNGQLLLAESYRELLSVSLLQATLMLQSHAEKPITAIILLAIYQSECSGFADREWYLSWVDTSSNDQIFSYIPQLASFNQD